MTFFLLKRIFFIIPTLFMVCAVAFFLKNEVPGDTVEAILVFQGVAVEDQEVRQNEYNKIYREQNLDKPIFYFSILPKHYPRNLNAIEIKQLKNEVKYLLTQGYVFEDILHYYKTKTDLIEQLKHDLENQEKEIQQKHSTWINELNFTSDIVKIEQLLSTESHKLNTEKLQSAISTLKANKVHIVVPKFYWYGLENQFHLWLKSIATFDLGTSLKDGKLVSKKIFKAMNWTIALVFFSLLVLCFVAIPLGIYSGRHERGKMDIWVNRIATAFFAIPVFWLATVLILFFTTDQYSPWLNIFPTVGTFYSDDSMGFFTNLWYNSKQLILPVICMIFNDFALLIRMVRGNTIVQKNQLYTKVAISKGLTDDQVLFRHILPNVTLNIITLLVGVIASAFAGSLIIEVIFNIPGMGRLLYNSILSADWNVVFGALIVLSFLTILINLIGDILYAVLNPKIKLS